MSLDLTPRDDPEQDPPERQNVARRSTWVSVLVNLVLTAIQSTATVTRPRTTITTAVTNAAKRPPPRFWGCC